MMSDSAPTPAEERYQGQFGDFVVTAHDRREVVIYRIGMAIAAGFFAIGVALALTQPPTPLVLALITLCYAGMWVGLGISLWFIHIYMVVLHRALQAFWFIGGVASVAIAIATPATLPQVVYDQPLTLFGIGFTFAALTGIYFKEAFCFNRFETKILTPLVPFLLLGHLAGWLPLGWERGLLITWAGLFLVFAGRKLVQAIPPDIGDKSVFAYLRGEVTVPAAEPTEAAS